MTKGYGVMDTKLVEKLIRSYIEWHSEADEEQKKPAEERDESYKTMLATAEEELSRQVEILDAHGKPMTADAFYQRLNEMRQEYVNTVDINSPFFFLRDKESPEQVHALDVKGVYVGMGGKIDVTVNETPLNAKLYDEKYRPHDMQIYEMPEKPGIFAAAYNWLYKQFHDGEESPTYQKYHLAVRKYEKMHHFHTREIQPQNNGKMNKDMGMPDKPDRERMSQEEYDKELQKYNDFYDLNPKDKTMYDKDIQSIKESLGLVKSPEKPQPQEIVEEIKPESLEKPQPQENVEEKKPESPDKAQPQEIVEEKKPESPDKVQEVVEEKKQESPDKQEINKEVKKESPEKPKPEVVEEDDEEDEYFGEYEEDKEEDLEALAADAKDAFDEMDEEIESLTMTSKDKRDLIADRMRFCLYEMYGYDSAKWAPETKEKVAAISKEIKQLAEMDSEEIGFLRTVPRESMQVMIENYGEKVFLPGSNGVEQTSVNIKFWYQQATQEMPDKQPQENEPENEFELTAGNEII